MDVRTELVVNGGKHGCRLVVEPWADEFAVAPGETGRVVAVHESERARFGVEHHPDCLVVWVNQGGSTYEFWRGQDRER